MSSGKRYSDANPNSVVEKSGHANSSVSHRNNGGHAPLQGNKQRTRLAGGPTNAKLAVPLPVNLPSLRKESQGHEPHTHLATQTTGVAGWQRPEESATADQSTWSQHGASRTALWNRGLSGNLGDHGTPSARPPVLDQEEFPSLEAAAHAKGQPAKSKPHKTPSTQEERKEWADEERPTANPPPSRSTWEDDERLGQQGEMPLPYGGAPPGPHPGYLPIEAHRLPATELYPHPSYFHPRPSYYTPPPGAMQPGFRPPEYYGPPGDTYYAPYVHPMYAHPPIQHGYHHPDMYADQGLFPPMPHPHPEAHHRLSQRPSYTADEEFEMELKPKANERQEQLKAEAEHPRTPDNLSGEGPVRLIQRQESVEDRSISHEAPPYQPLLRKMSLPKSSSQKLKARVKSEEMDWGAQVDAEETYWKKNEVKILSKHSEEPSPSPQANGQEAVTRTEDVQAETASSQRWRASHSPMSRGGTSRGERSSDISTRRSCQEAVGMWRTGPFSRSPRENDQWQSRRSGTLTPQSQRGGHTLSPQPDPSFHERWSDQCDFAPRGRGGRGGRDREGFRGRGRDGFGGRGRDGFGGRGRDGFGGRGRERFVNSLQRPVRAEGERQFPSAAPEGRRHFPGRGFRPKGPPPKQEPTPEAAKTPTQKSEDAIQFGQFDVSLRGEFDPFAGTAPLFASTSAQSSNRAEVPPSKDPRPSTAPANQSEPHLPVGPAHMDLASSLPYLGTVLPDEQEVSETPKQSSTGTPSARSHTGSERGGFGGRYPRGRFHRRGGRFHQGDGRGRGHQGRHSHSFDRFRHPHHDHPANFNADDSNRRFHKDRHPSTSHRWGSDSFSREGRDDWHHRHHDRSPYPRKPPGRGRFSHQGRGRGGRHGGRSFESLDADGSARSTSSSTRMHWVPKMPSSETPNKDQPAEE